MKSCENENEQNKSKKFVKFSKKFRKKYKILKTIILIIVLLFFVHFIRNFIILTSQYRHIDEHIIMNNYHVRRYFYQLDTVLFEDMYYKDGNALELSCFSNTNHFNTNEYTWPDFINVYNTNNNKKYSYMTDSNTGIKYYYETDYNFAHDYNILYASDRPSFLAFIFQSAVGRIDSTKCNGIDCYRIISNYDGYNQYSYFDKKTGFPVRGTNPVTLQNGQKYLLTTDLFIEFGTVTDEDLKVPNGDEYKPYKDVEDILSNAMLKYNIENNDLESFKANLQYMIDENIEINPEYYEKYKYLLEE